MDKKTQFIRPRRHISQKVSKTGGPTPEKAILEALNAAEDIISGYQGWAVDDMEELWETFLGFVETGHRSISRDDITEMYNLAHEARGQGGSFGFPLITGIADSLCKFLDGRGDLNDIDLDITRIHILALKAVFRQNLKGDCGALSREIPNLLLALRNKASIGKTETLK